MGAIYVDQSSSRLDAHSNKVVPSTVSTGGQGSMLAQPAVQQIDIEEVDEEMEQAFRMTVNIEHKNTIARQQSMRHGESAAADDDLHR
mmetsp:Transcript_10771/g.13491  ORF Transcript_10771/g.13491 Transcript_10771/m.13491 type:complete len:88 (+) Transcript_10771:110-373(+)